MPNYKAKELVEAGEAEGLSHEDMAELCGVSVGTVSRWKTVGRARTKAIAPLIKRLKKDSPGQKKYLDEASLEDLAERARQLGFRVSFTDMSK